MDSRPDCSPWHVNIQLKLPAPSVGRSLRTLPALALPSHTRNESNHRTHNGDN